MADPRVNSVQNQAIQRYEADKVLSQEDRLYMRDRLYEVRNVTLKSALVGFAVGFSSPLVYLYKKYGHFKAVNWQYLAIPGGLLMSITSSYGTQYSMKRQMERTQKDGRQNCLNMMRLISPDESSSFWVYYQQTVNDPTKTFADPRNSNERPKELSSANIPPKNESILRDERVMDAFKSSNTSPFTKDDSVDKDPFGFDDDTESPGNFNTSSWASIRNKNGVQSSTRTAWDTIRASPQELKDRFPQYTSSPTSHTSTRDSRGPLGDEGLTTENIDQEAFDRLLERERQGSDGDKW